MSGLGDNVRQIIEAYRALSKENRAMAKIGFEIVDAVENPSAPILPVADQPAFHRTSPKRSGSWNWGYCEAIDANGQNLKPYPNAVACWRAEIGDPKTTGFTGRGNANALESFRNAGWTVASGDPNHKELGMRVIRPRNFHS